MRNTCLDESQARIKIAERNNSLMYVRDISDNKYINIWITGIPEGEERQKV